VIMKELATDGVIEKEMTNRLVQNKSDRILCDQNDRFVFVFVFFI
jgi:hypothetical protein